MSEPVWTTDIPSSNGNYWLRQANVVDEIVYLRDEYVEYHGTEKDIHVSKIDGALWCAVDGKPKLMQILNEHEAHNQTTP